jgi:hypothetical protein
LRAVSGSGGPSQLHQISVYRIVIDNRRLMQRIGRVHDPGQGGMLIGAARRVGVVSMGLPQPILRAKKLVAGIPPALSQRL